MARALRFFFVDVFASRALEGNPLAVVADADGLDESLMGAIAREFNQSETTFLMTPTRADADWRLRSFTPGRVEVGGAGHNALGAWWWLAAAGRIDLDDGRTAFAQEIGDRLLPVEVSATGGRPESIAMEQEPPERRQQVDDMGELTVALGLADGDLAPDLPTQVLSTGAPHLLVQARDRNAVDRATPEAPRLAAVLAEAGGEGCYVYSLDPVDSGSAAYARFFNPTVGIAEDPATGTAAGPLAVHLIDHGVAEEGSIVIEQGHFLGRPSQIALRVHGERVTISGAAIVAAEGTLQL